MTKKTIQISLLLLCTKLVVMLPVRQSLANQISVPPPETTPLDLSLLGNSAPGTGAIGPEINQAELTIPSLWWAWEQFGGKLLETWLPYPGRDRMAGRVDLVVNRHVWNLSNYLERYQFVNKLGTVARDRGYNTRVFNRQGEFLAAYTCNFNSSQLLCQITLESLGRVRWRGRGNS